MSVYLGENKVGVGMYEKVLPREKARYVLDANGNATPVSGALDLSDIVSVGTKVLQYGFYGCTYITSVDLSSLTSVESNGLQYGFSSCSKLTSVDLSSLTSVGNFGLSYCFMYCYKLEVVHFDECPSVVPIDSNTFTMAGVDVPGGYKVVVPDALYDDWCAAQYWSDIADHIVKVSEYVPTPNDPFAD